MNTIKYEKYLGEAMVSVSENCLYISAKSRREMGLIKGDYFNIFFDKDTNIISIKRVDSKEPIKFEVNKQGYCQIKISRVMEKGRYAYDKYENGSFIFKK